jgi:hypothetical protein
VGGFDRVIATSSTAAAVICALNGIDRKTRELSDRKRATVAQVDRLVTELAAEKLTARRKRIGIGPLALGDLPEGRWRRVDPREWGNQDPRG